MQRCVHRQHVPMGHEGSFRRACGPTCIAEGEDLVLFYVNVLILQCGDASSLTYQILEIEQVELGLFYLILYLLI